MINPGQVSLGEITIKSLYTCPPTLSPGDPVYQSGAGAVDLSDCTDIGKMPCIGVVERKVSINSCLVVQAGEVHKAGWGLVTERNYFAGPAGTIVDAPSLPSDPGTVVQEIGYAKIPETFVVVLDLDWTVIE
jgi:hypothetical protein